MSLSMGLAVVFTTFLLERISSCVVIASFFVGTFSVAFLTGFSKFVEVVTVFVFIILSLIGVLFQVLATVMGVVLVFIVIFLLVVTFTMFVVEGLVFAIFL